MCMCVCMYVCACVCVRVFVCICICDDCVQGIFQLFQLQEAYRMKNGMYVYDCVRACVCVCECMANGCTCMFDSLGSEGVNFL